MSESNLKVPEAMSNTQLEKLLLAFDEITDGNGRTSAVIDVLTESAEQHGKDEIARMLGTHLIEFLVSLGPDYEPSEEHYRESAREHLADGNENKAVCERERYFRKHAHYHLRVRHYCNMCGCVRDGREWRHGVDIPDDWTLEEQTCPDCQAWINTGCERLEEMPYRDGRNRDQMNADMLRWLAEGVDADDTAEQVMVPTIEPATVESKVMA